MERGVTQPKNGLAAQVMEALPRRNDKSPTIQRGEKAMTKNARHRDADKISLPLGLFILCSSLALGSVDRIMPRRETGAEGLVTETQDCASRQRAETAALVEEGDPG